MVAAVWRKTHGEREGAESPRNVLNPLLSLNPYSVFLDFRPSALLALGVPPLTGILSGYTFLIEYIHAMEGDMQVSRWGNSLAVRLPVAVVDALELKEGDEIEVHVADARNLGIARKPGRDELLKRLRAFRGRLPPDFKFDRDEANAR
jgi:antitoxin MazE